MVVVLTREVAEVGGTVGGRERRERKVLRAEYRVEDFLRGLASWIGVGVGLVRRRRSGGEAVREGRRGRGGQWALGALVHGDDEKVWEGNEGGLKDMVLGGRDKHNTRSLKLLISVYDSPSSSSPVFPLTRLSTEVSQAFNGPTNFLYSHIVRLRLLSDSPRRLPCTPLLSVAPHLEFWPFKS